ncbi:hypothetical protein J0X14_05965 [Muricauda sp. CAU 1633]|nr:hypothetical protein [Muricauda sp. CAU 1633]MBO0321834.1 hypothetical protein [Muricauda sp. CAU 1633]
MAQTFYLLMDMVTFADRVRDRGDILFCHLEPAYVGRQAESRNRKRYSR